MDEAPIKPIEKKNDATKRMRVRFTIMASFISGECRHLRETHGNIKAVPPGSRMHPSVHRLSVMGWWSQLIDATLYLKRQRWSVWRCGKDIVEVSLRPRKRS